MSPNFNTYKMSLQQINSQINQVKTERRIKTLKETGLSILRILGYISIGSIILYVLYKCKCWQFLSKCAPHTLCINILSSTEFEDLVDIQYSKISPLRFETKHNLRRGECQQNQQPEIILFTYLLFRMYPKNEEKNKMYCYDSSAFPLSYETVFFMLLLCTFILIALPHYHYH